MEKGHNDKGRQEKIKLQGKKKNKDERKKEKEKRKREKRWTWKIRGEYKKMEMSEKVIIMTASIVWYRENDLSTKTDIFSLLSSERVKELTAAVSVSI